MALQTLTMFETIVKEFGDQLVFISQSSYTVADITRWQNPKLLAKSPRATAVISHCDDRCDVISKALEAAQ